MDICLELTVFYPMPMRHIAKRMFISQNQNHPLNTMGLKDRARLNQFGYPTYVKKICFLQQLIEGKQQPLGFFSRAFSKAQVNYSTYDRELLAIFEAIRYFRPLIEGREFTVFTHHIPLTHALVQHTKTACPRQVRQLNFISQFTTDIRYQPGEENLVADALSRIEEVCLPDNFQQLAKAQEQDSTIQQPNQRVKLRLHREQTLTYDAKHQLVLHDLTYLKIHNHYFKNSIISAILV